MWVVIVQIHKCFALLRFMQEVVESGVFQRCLHQYPNSEAERVGVTQSTCFSVTVLTIIGWYVRS